MRNSDRYDRPRGGRDWGRTTMHRTVCDDCGLNCEVPFKPTGEKPVYCSDCFGHNNSDRDSGRGRWRDSDRGRDSWRERPTMHRAVCDDCWDDCEVPFRPTWDKPIYCSDCFGGWDRDSSRGRWRDSGRRDSWRDSGRDRATMHNAVCDDCWDDCEVPFKPSSDKPVFCSECFGKNKSNDRKSNNCEVSLEQFEMLSEKLDKVLEALGVKDTKKEKPKKEEKKSKKEVKEPKSEENTEEKEEAEKPAAKKATAKKTATKKPAAKKETAKKPAAKKTATKKATTKKK